MPLIHRKHPSQLVYLDGVLIASFYNYSDNRNTGEYTLEVVIEFADEVGVRHEPTEAGYVLTHCGTKYDVIATTTIKTHRNTPEITQVINCAKVQ